MSSTRIYLDYLDHILDSIRKIKKFIYNLHYDDFAIDEKTQYAVIRALEIIGEASKNIPQDIRVMYPDIPWKEMSGMRDKLIHDYFGVDTQLIWKTATEDVVSIEKSIAEIKKNLSS
jgi:uncharacterized protein with HEPN domain